MSTTQIDDGGPAFPIPYGQVTCESGKGMTLRDWFAGQALAGLVFHNDYGATISDQDIAKGAYSFADAMITARKEKS